MRADRDKRLIRRNYFFNFRLFFFCDRPRQKHSFHFGYVLFNYLIILGCQNFGGCHNGNLFPAFNGYKHRNKRNRRFAAPNVALQKPVHNRIAEHIFINVVDGVLLPVGKLEREARSKIFDIAKRTIIAR